MGGKWLVGLAAILVMALVTLFGLGAFDPPLPQTDYAALQESPAPRREQRERAEASASAAATPSNPPPGANATARGGAAIAPPRFDVVRVGARGSAVIAGRAAPGAEVILLSGNGRELGRARADRRGEFVILPAEAFPPGAIELSLTLQQGEETVIGPDRVVLVVPDSAGPGSSGTASATAEAARTDSSGALAVLLPPVRDTAPPRLLQAPEPGRRDQTPARLGIDSVDYDSEAAMRFAGTAPSGGRVRLYVDDRHIGDTLADEAGRWAFSPSEQPALGRHQLRVDQISPRDGQVTARVSVPFQREELPAEAFRDQRLVVQPGANLWRIARATYGSGTRYTVIYQANREQITDPNRIFPGQVFALPTAQPAPAASSRSR